MSSSHLINRETLANGTIRQMALERDGPDSAILTEEELIASRREFIPDNHNKERVVIWVRLFDLESCCPSHRTAPWAYLCFITAAFALRQKLAGSPELPGLILGLDNGGSCTGLALKIDKSIIADELDLLWSREMINRSYTPKKVCFYAEDGTQLEAITFVMNHESPSYVAEMSLEESSYHCQC